MGIVSLNPMAGYRFCVVEDVSNDKNGLAVRSCKIAIKNNYNQLIFTELEKFVTERKYIRTKQIEHKGKLSYICSFLNYIFIDNYLLYKAESIVDITYEMVNDYFISYTERKNKSGGYISEDTIKKCMYTVLRFLEKMIRSEGGSSMKLKKEDLFKNAVYYDRKKRLTATRLVPNFSVVCKADYQSKFKDMSEDELLLLLDLALNKDPSLAMAICLGAFAGLRAAEVCNVRLAQDIRGAGINITRFGDEIESIEIDVRREYAMRSDGKIVGTIKKPRVQKIYPDFIEVFNSVYEAYLRYRNTLKTEEGYYPLIVNHHGMAYTVSAYTTAFRKLVKEDFIPALLKGDSRMQITAKVIMQKGMGIHALRHWFSCYIMNHTQDAVLLKNWRGDSNIESSQVYLANKSALENLYKSANNKFARVLIKELEEDENIF